MKRLDRFLSDYRKEKTFFRKTEFSFPEGYENIVAGYYTVGKENEVFCFIGYPKTEMPQGGYPAVVLIHGGSGYAFFEWVKHWTDRGYVAISPDLDGHYATDKQTRLVENPKGGPHGYGSMQDYNEKCPWMFFCMASISAAVDILIKDTFVNGDQVVAQGISWGGFLGLIAAAKEKRLKALSVVYSSAFISDSDWAMEWGLKPLSKEQLVEYDENIDPQTYLEEIEIPVFFTAGMDDGAFMVRNRIKTVQAIRSQKMFSFRRSFIHGHVEGWTKAETEVFFKYVLTRKDLPFLAVSDKKIIIENMEAEKIGFVYTQENPKEKDICEWTETEEIEQVLQSATVYFVYGITKEGYIFSSNVYYHKDLKG